MYFVKTLLDWKTVGLNLHKRAEIFLLALLVSTTSITSASLDSLSVGFGNDWYTMGLGYNQDDGFSFGASLEARFDNGLMLQTCIRGYTDRIQSNQRYDEMQISASYPFQFHPYPNLGIAVIGSAGGIFSGNLGLQTVQNSFHSLIHRTPVNLLYFEDQARFHPYLALRAQAGYLVSNTFAGLELQASYAYRWEQVLEANLFISYGGSLAIRLGYVEKFVEDIYPSQSIQEKQYEGLRLAFAYDGGLFQTSYFSFLESGASYGSYAVNALAFKEPKTFRQSNFTFAFGILYNYMGHQNRLFAFGYGPFSFETRQSNGPMLNYWENQDDRMNLGSWLFGYRWDLGQQASRFFSAYVKALAGLQRFNLQQDYTTTLVEEIRPSLGMEVGMRIGTASWFVVGNKSYHPRLALSLHYVFGTDSIKENVTIEEFEPHLGPWIIMAGIVLDIEHDLTEI